MSIGHNNEARNTKFMFMIGDSRELMFSAQSSNVNDITFGHAPFPTGAKDLKIPTNKIENSPLTVDILLSEDYNEWIEVYRWILSCKNNNDSHVSQVKVCELITLDSQNQPLTSFIYGDTFPIELSGLRYVTNADKSSVLVFTVTLVFNSFKVRLPNGEVIDEQYTN